MNTLSRLRSAYEIDQINLLIAGKARDRYAPIDQELDLRASMYDAWQAQLAQAVRALDKFHELKMFSSPSIEEVPQMMKILGDALSGSAINNRIQDSIQRNIKSTFASASDEVDREMKRQTGKAAPQKGGVGFGVLFGITEEHAVQALHDFGTLSAGGLWEDQMSESVRISMEEWYEGNMTRTELVTELKSLTNARLSIEGQKSLARSYFEGLAEHLIVRTRNIGKLYRAKKLGVTKYRFRNPDDHRTSPICEKLNGHTYEVAAAESVVSDILGASSLDDLKAVQPFWKSPDENRVPMPPIHWRCRSWIEMVFEELEAGVAEIEGRDNILALPLARSKWYVDTYGNLTMKQTGREIELVAADKLSGR
jgi:hypothetical protein